MTVYSVNHVANILIEACKVFPFSIQRYYMRHYAVLVVAALT